jgi:hypothetical protein
VTCDRHDLVVAAKLLHKLLADDAGGANDEDSHSLSFLAESWLAELIAETRPRKLISKSPLAKLVPETRLCEFVAKSRLHEFVAEAEPLAREHLLRTEEALLAKLIWAEWLLESLVRESFAKLVSSESLTEPLIREPLPELLIWKAELSFPEFLVRELFAELLATESLAALLVREALPKLIASEPPVHVTAAESSTALLCLGRHSARARTYLTTGSSARPRACLAARCGGRSTSASRAACAARCRHTLQCRLAVGATGRPCCHDLRVARAGVETDLSHFRR